MPRLFSRSSQKAFTLLELIVVIVILGVLAGIAIPTFLTSQSKARDAVTSESLAATAHNAAALAALDQAFSDGNFSTAASESNLTALAPGLFAATAASAVAYNSSTGAGYASRPGVNGASGATAFTLSYQISPDKQSAGLAVVAPSGNCLMDVVSLTSNQKPWSYADLGANCNGSVALAGPTQPTPSKVAPGTPTIVTGFTAAVASGTSVNLAWTAPTTGAASYLVSWTGGGSQSVPGTATSVQITGLTPSTSYTFSIVAQNVSNVAGPSASAGPVTTWSAALSSPSGLSASPGSNTVSLSWSAVSNAVSYNVYRGSTFLASSSTPSYTDSTAVNGTTYSYQVSSIDSHGQEGAPSPAVSAKPLPPIPGQVTGLTATAGNASVALSWTAQPQASTYNVYKGATIVASVAAPATTYTLTGLTNGTSYSFQVSSVDTFNQEGTPSAAASATPITVASAPQSVSATPSQTTMAVSWSAPASTGGSAISSYTVSISPAPASGSSFQSVTGTSASFANLVANTAYTVSVVAMNGAGSSAAGTASATTWNVTPSAPTNVAATASGTSATISWSASTPAGGTISSYSVYRGGTLITTVSAPTTSYTDTGLSANTTYSYQVSETDSHAQVSGLSGGVSASTVPAAPSGLSAANTTTANSVVLNWTGSNAVTAYNVLRNGTVIGSTAGTTYTDTTGTSQASYLYTVTATNAAGTSGASNTAAAVAGSKYATAVLGDGAYTYYRLEETSGTTLNDSTIGQWKGSLGGTVLTGQTGAVQSQTGYGMNFANGIATLNGANNGNVETIEFWMDAADVTKNQMPVSFGGAYDLWMCNGNFGFNTGNGDSYGIAAPFANYTWYHVVAEVHSAAGGGVTANKLWINGVQQTLTQRAGTPLAANETLSSAVQVSGWQGAGNAYTFNGTIDDVSNYYGTLSTTMVQNHYNAAVH